MADTFTANYNFTKPDINASRDTWGVKWNDNIDVIDTSLKGLQDSKLPWNQTTKAVTTQVDFTNVKRPKVTGAKTPLSAALTEAATLGDLVAAVPMGIICSWYGTVGTIPAGWALCDGTNGTPDLRGRFIYGATAGVGAVGGATTHSHTVGGTSLTIAQLPSHSHGVNDPGHTHAINDPGHAHSYARSDIANGNALQSNGERTLGTTGGATGENNTGISIVSRVTGISIAAQGSGATHTHTMEAVGNLPPFMILCYIMKLAAA